MPFLDRVMRGVAPYLPKIITPKMHAWIDYTAVGAYYLVGFLTRDRYRKASIASFAIGSGILALSLVTDYPGGVIKMVSFPTHGKVDGAQTVTSAGLPSLLGFEDTAPGRFFEIGAAAELSVLGMTQWRPSDQARMRIRRRRAA